MTASTMTVLIVAGGTGGHIFPALAVAQELQRQGHAIVWLGTPGHMEAKIVPEHGLPIEFIRFGGVRGKGLKTLLTLPLSLLRAFADTWRVLRRVKPQVVVAFGGYVSFPAGMMASLAGIPLVLHEQNAVAGSANKALVPLADAALSAFPKVLKGGIAVGNPVRDAIAELPEPAVRYATRSGPLRVLVIGGSLGAQALNAAVPMALAKLPADQRPVVTHQAGAKHLEQLQHNYRQAGVQAQTLAFIDDMAQAYAQADLVIGRAGATTVFELAAAGLPAIFVPFPHAIDDHQTANARWLVDAGAAWLAPQIPGSLEQAAARLADDLARLLGGMSRPDLMYRATIARGKARPLAALDVARVCEQLGAAKLQGQSVRAVSKALALQAANDASARRIS